MKKTFVKPQATVTEIESQQVICASNGLTGSSNTGITNGGTTNGGGVKSVDAKAGGAGIPKMNF